MRAIENGWRLGEVLVADATILYAVDMGGMVRFAVEEEVEGQSSTGYVNLGVPYSRRKASERRMKLGHPVLVRGAGARISGEILFQAGESGGRWTINAASGRYGRYVYRDVRLSQHVDSVIDVFKLHGITLENRFDD